MALNTPCSAITYAELTDIPNMQTATQNLALSLDTKVIPKFATSTARTSAIVSPVDGQMCYRTDTKWLECYSTATSTWKVLVPDGPRGIVARGNRTTNSTGTTTETGVLKLAVSVVAGRAYNVLVNPGAYTSTVANDVIGGRLRYTTDGSAPTTSSTILAQGSSMEPATVQQASPIFAKYLPATSHTFTVTLFVARTGGTGTVSLTANPDIDILIEDVGLAVSDTGVDL
jgi:hypothetical protein